MERGDVVTVRVGVRWVVGRGGEVVRVRVGVRWVMWRGRRSCMSLGYCKMGSGERWKSCNS